MPPVRRSLELSGINLAERGVPAPLVIEHLDVVEQCLLGVCIAFEVLALLALHRREPMYGPKMWVTLRSGFSQQPFVGASVCRALSAGGERCSSPPILEAWRSAVGYRR